MELAKSKIGVAGIFLGSGALLLALIHFWGGPFSPQPTLEATIAEKAASLRKAAVDALAGKEIDKTSNKRAWNIDRVIDLIIPIISVAAIILAVFSFIGREPKRVSGCAAVLGISAIAFQFIAMYAMALLVVLLIVAVLGSIGGG